MQPECRVYRAALARLDLRAALESLVPPGLRAFRVIQDRLGLKGLRAQLARRGFKAQPGLRATLARPDLRGQSAPLAQQGLKGLLA